MPCCEQLQSTFAAWSDTGPWAQDVRAGSKDGRAQDPRVGVPWLTAGLVRHIIPGLGCQGWEQSASTQALRKAGHWHLVLGLGELHLGM